ncbi:MAG TPA: carboxypeptidase-like regulatory domain-containing protein, partial [Chitinophagaceae bacterium]|nr:carboxypeptidase-like regulatory domain-containing protein [Chitinophagaceae bacterium]
MRSLLILASFLIASVASAQNIIKGRVVHEKSREPIAGASVFISNSTKGTVSKADGSFELVDVPTGSHDLVASSIGYATLVFSYTTADLPLKVELQLQPRVTELESVTVEPDEANGWEKWGRFFVENFIGTMANAADCKLKNPKALRFKHSRKNNTLTVIADEPLIIENKALGYKIQYQLEDFTYDFKTRYLVFLGYTLFEDMDGRDRQKRRWAANRVTAFNGSLQHFMKSLYNDQLAADGYEVKRMRKQDNTEKLRIRAVYKARMDSLRAKGEVVRLGFGDSTAYYERIMGQPDQFDIISPGILTADSLITPGNGEIKTLFFENYLYITYRNEKEEEGYARSSMPPHAPYFQRSTISLPALNPISIDSLGNYS